MTPSTMENQGATGQRLVQSGVLLFLLGLLTGFVVPLLANPRMGLSSHLEGVMNGLFLVAVGLVWPGLKLPAAALRLAFWLAIYGTFANWAATGLAAAWGAGALMPIAGGGQHGTPAQEGVITVFLVSLSIAMVAVCVLLLWGLAGAGPRSDGRSA